MTDQRAGGTAPTMNWRRMHLGWGMTPKQSHRTWLGAWLHLAGHRRRYRDDADLVGIYPCWFTDANTYGRRHYHVGHIPGARKKTSGPPLARLEKGVLFLGVFATPDGFEVRTFGTRPPGRYPPQPTPAAALAAYLQDHPQLLPGRT